jgi:acyl carrier protein
MPESNIEEEVRRLLTDVSGRDASTLEAESDLVNELGLDSLAGLRVLAAVEKRFDVRFPDARLGEFRTLQHLLDFISAESP